jgi:hypothetical protein
MSSQFSWNDIFDHISRGIQTSLELGYMEHIVST